jgi:hypothetical protein
VWAGLSFLSQSVKSIGIAFFKCERGWHSCPNLSKSLVLFSLCVNGVGILPVCEWGFGLPFFLLLLIPCVRACVCRRICALPKRSFVAMEASRPWCLADNSTPSQVILPSPLCHSKKLETEVYFRGKIEVVFSSFHFLFLWFISTSGYSDSFHARILSEDSRRCARSTISNLFVAGLVSLVVEENQNWLQTYAPSKLFPPICIVNSTQMYAMWWNAQTRSRIECLVKNFLDSLVAHEPAIKPLSMARSSILRFCWVHISVYFPCSQSLGQYNRWFKESLQEVPGVQRKIEPEGTSSFQWSPEE